MFYRRKVLLSLFQVFGGELEKIRLQKLLFLFTRCQTKTEYDFVPYKYGCFSYSANADITAMVNQALLTESPTHYKSKTSGDYLTLLKDQDRRLISEIKVKYGKMDADALMRYTYVHYPYYAINSKKAASLLSKEELRTVLDSRIVGNKTILFTIGYEGISLEEYLNRLIRNDVRVLIDVRNNAASMKYGFHKKQMERFCDNLGIQYVHIPEVGVQSEKRQKLNTQKDYDNLFINYNRFNLPKTKKQQELIFNLLTQHKRVALTCFEANICQCHRTHLAEAIKKNPNFRFEIKHI